MNPKDVIKEAAIKIISEEGFYNCNTDKIAREAGYSVGTIYNYFKNKEDILNYIFAIEQQEMGKIFDQVKNQDCSVPVIIHSFFEQYFDRVMNNVRLGKIILDESNRLTRDLNDEILSFLLLINDFFKDMINKGIEEGSIKKDIDPEMMATAIMGATNSVVLQGYLNPDKLNKIFRQAPDNLYQIFERGIFIEDR